MFVNGMMSYSIDNIDEEKTIENGKEICSQYRPLVEKRIKRILATPLNSASIVIFSGSAKNQNAFENQLIERCAWNDDQITNFINNILLLEKSDKIVGGYLKYKYIYDLTDKQIASKFKVTDRTLRSYKNKAYYQMAVWSNKIEFVYCKTFHFIIK